MNTSDILGYGGSRAYIPLPPVLKAEGEWEGGAILREFPSPLGLVLFGTVRDVMLWLLPAKHRVGSLFHDGAVEIRRAQLEEMSTPAQIAECLEVLVKICDTDLDLNEVGNACLGVADWANGINAPHTQLAYTQAGAIALPDSLQHALETARLARELSQYRRSETWFRRTIKRARIIKDRSTYVLGYLGLGNLYGRVGNGPAAKGVLELALRQATRWKLRELMGRAHHDLIRVFAELRNLRAAYEHAAEAGRHYRGFPGLQVRLAVDVATLWMRVGAFERSLAVYEAVFPLASHSGVRAVVAAQIARSAASLGFIERYEDDRSRAVVAAGESNDLFFRADALLQLAHADLALCRWDRAANTAEEALRTATLIGAAETSMEAERAVNSARAQRREGAFVDLLQEPPALSRVGDKLARSLHEAIAP